MAEAQNWPFQLSFNAALRVYYWLLVAEGHLTRSLFGADCAAAGDAVGAGWVAAPPVLPTARRGTRGEGSV